ncbi:MAG: O-antigen ligase family protein [Cyclobacteriaceae bacterium]|nr:O-antigen ligase family protein [Cyclobacteriaceae bacterium]
MKTSFTLLNKKDVLITFVLLISAVLFPFLLKNGPNYMGPLLLLGIFTFPILLLVLFDYRTGIYLLLLYGAFMFLIDRLLSVDLPLGILFDLLIVLIFFVLIVQLKTRGEFKWKLNSPITICHILFYIYFTLEALNPNSISPFGWLSAFRFYFYLLLFYIFIHYFSEVENIKKFTKLWLSIALLAGFYGIFQEIFGLRSFEMKWLYEVPGRYELYFIWGRLRKFSFLSDPSAYGLFMAYSATSVLVLVFGPYKRIYIFLFATTAVIMLVAMSFAGTRTAYAMVMISIVFFIILNIRNRKIIIASLVMGFVFLVLMFGPFYSAPILRMRSTFNVSNDASMGVRDYKRLKFQPYIQSHPFGGGINTAGNSGLRYAKGHPLAGKFDPDSGYLRTGMEMGSIGLFLSLLLNCVVMIQGVANHYNLKDKFLRNINIVFVVPFLGLSVAHFTQDALLQKPLNLLVIGTYALMIVLKDLDSKYVHIISNTNEKLN